MSGQQETTQRDARKPLPGSWPESMKPESVGAEAWRPALGGGAAPGRRGTERRPQTLASSGVAMPGQPPSLASPRP